MLVRPVADIASFPAPGWTTAPLFEKVNSVDPDDSTFITGLAPGAQDPQVALQLGDLDIPYGASGQIRLRARIAWSAALTMDPDTVRVGLGTVAALASSDPTLILSRTIVGFTSTDFTEIEVTFDYEDWSADSASIGFYLEMTPNSADTSNPLLAWVEVESCVPALICDRCSIGDLTPREVIREARDYHPTFEERGHPDAVLLRTLSSYEKQVSGRLSKSYPSLIASGITVNLPIATFANGILLPAITYVLPGVEVRKNLIVNTIELVNLTMRSDHTFAPGMFVYLRGKRLFLSAPEQQWTNWDSINFQVVLTPRDVTGLDQLLMLPNHAHDAYVGELVKKMAIRQGLGDVAQIGAGMQETAFATIAQQKGAETFVTRDDFPGSW